MLANKHPTNKNKYRLLIALNFISFFIIWKFLLTISTYHKGYKTHNTSINVCSYFWNFIQNINKYEISVEPLFIHNLTCKNVASVFQLQ